jgi:RNA polymerase primary sigma factor
MPAQKSKKPAKPAAKTVAKAAKPAAKAQPAVKAAAKAAAKPAVKPAAKAAAKTATKAQTVPASKTPAKTAKTEKTAKTPAAELKKAAAATEEGVAKKKPGRPPKAASAESAAPPAKTGAKRGRKPKNAAKPEEEEDVDLEAEFAEETPEAGASEKVKPLRMKISKAKERALMKEFGLDETVLSEEDMQKRRQRLKLLIKLGKTRGYLTHGEISDHLPDKLVDAETLEVVISMLNDMGVAVYEQTPDAETLLLNNTGPTAATDEEAEEEAEAALSTVDSEVGRTQAHRRRPDGHDGGHQRLSCHHRRDPAHGRGDP